MPTSTFMEIITQESIEIPEGLAAAKRLQRYNTKRSIDFIVDEVSIENFKNQFPLKCYYPTMIKIMENIIICHREKHFRLQKTRLQLMNGDNYNYRNQSFYYSIDD